MEDDGSPSVGIDPVTTITVVYATNSNGTMDFLRHGKLLLTLMN